MCQDHELRFNFAMPVWGRHHVEMLLHVGLPTQLTQGNLLGFPWRNKSVYEFYTTEPDAKEIAESPVFRLLDKNLETRFVYVDDQLPHAKSKWSVLRYCQREAVRSADARDAAIYFSLPDLAWSEASVTNAARRIAAGYSAVLCPGLRTRAETMAPALRSGFLSSDGCSIPVPARKLVELGLEHTHPETITWTWGSEDYMKCPSYILHPVEGEGVCAFCYILHPVVVNPQVRGAPFRKIFDQDYLEAACPDTDRIYVAQDSDEICQFELSPPFVPLEAPREARRMDGYEAMAWWGEWQFNRQHRSFVKKPVRIHHTNLMAERWESIEHKGMKIVDRIEKKWTQSDWKLLLSTPANLYRRLEGRYRFHEGSIPIRDSIAMRAASAWNTILRFGASLSMRPRPPRLRSRFLRERIPARR